jgi:plasmid segregation protein ParM
MVKEMTKLYVDDLLGTLRERGLDLKTGCVVFIGGGALLLREYLEISGKIGKCVFIEDICANAKGYELLYQVQKRGR